MGYFGSNYVKMFYECIDVDKTAKLTLAVNLSRVCPRPTPPGIININGTDNNLVWVCKEERVERTK